MPAAVVRALPPTAAAAVLDPWTVAEATLLVPVRSSAPCLSQASTESVAPRIKAIRSLLWDRYTPMQVRDLGVLAWRGKAVYPAWRDSTN